MTINLIKNSYTNYDYINKDFKSINELKVTPLQMAHSDKQLGKYMKIVDLKPIP